MIRDARDIFDVGSSIVDDIVNTDPAYFKQYVDIYSFFDKFVDVIKDLNLYSEDDEDFHKINIKQEYPDEEYKTGTTAVFKINKRHFFSPTSSIRKEGTEQRKPLTLRSSSDIITNNIIDDYGYYFTNNVELEVFSNSVEHLHNTIRLLETIIFKYKKNLKVYVHDVLYDGQSDLEYNAKYFKKRLLSKSLYLKVITCETYSLVSEEIKYIETIQKRKTL